MFKKNIRCLSAFVLAVLMLFSFAACGAKDADEKRNQDTNVDLNGDGDGVVRYSGEITFGYENGGYPTVVSPGSVGIKEEEEVEEEEKPQLTDGIALDVFPIIEQFIIYSGGNGGGCIALEIPDGYYQEINGCYFRRHEYNDDEFEIVYNNEVIGGFSIYLSKVTDDYTNQYYSNGDVFKIRISRTGFGSYQGGAFEDYVNEDIYEKGFLLPQIEKYYTVSGLGEYVTSYTQLSAAELEEIKNYVISSKLENSDYVDIKGCYEGKIKPFATAEPGSKFVIYVLAYYTMYEGTLYANEGYQAVAVDEIVRNPDGTLSFDLYNGWDLFCDGDTFEEREESILSNELYDFVKIA